ILHYHKVALIQSFSDFRKIRIRLCRILAEYVVCVDTFLFVFLMKDPVGHMSNGTADLAWKGYAPGFFKFCPCLRIRHILISWIGIWQSSHIAGSLNVILSADRTDTHCRTSEIACHKSQVRKTLHHV